MEIRIKTDSISPEIRRQAAALANPRPVMQAVGVALVQLTKRSFKDAALRPSSITLLS